MSVAFDERSLRFDFDDRWQPILKWDDHVAYRKGIHQVRGSKAMDFVGVPDNRFIYLIEARDFRRHSSEKEEPPHLELERKVRDTIAGLIGAGRRPEHADEFGPLLKSLIGQTRIVVVLWNEQPPYSGAAEVHRQRDVAGAGFLTERAKANVKWLHARVITTSQADRDKSIVPGLTVTNRARKPRELGVAILDLLKQRKIRIGEVTHARIASHTNVEDLEVWLERAARVSTIEALFDDH